MTIRTEQGKRGPEGPGVGKVYTSGPDAFTLEVCTVKELRVIIAHFDKYPLISQKRADF
jgi:hypothetical protein